MKKKFLRLDEQEKLPITCQLAEKYHIPPSIVAYLRVALLREDHKYNKDSLIQHILQENMDRKTEIAKLSINPNSLHQEHITAIQEKMRFREAVVVVLQNIQDAELLDILQEN